MTQKFVDLPNIEYHDRQCASCSHEHYFQIGGTYTNNDINNITPITICKTVACHHKDCNCKLFILGELDEASS